LTMKLTTNIMHKVRKTATRRLYGKTSIPSDKSLEEDWTPGSPTSIESQSEEFSVDGFDSDDLPEMPAVTIQSIRIEEKKEESVTRRSPRVVVFDEEVLVRRVRPVYQVGGTIDRRELWYQEEEYKEIMWKARRLVKRAHNDEENENKEKYCLRGLEHVMNSIKQRTKANLDGREAVLDEQHAQFEAEVFPLDDNKIASVYTPYTKAHRIEALQRAHWDAEEVALYQQTTTENSPPSRMNSSHSSSSLSLRSLASSQVPQTPATSQKKSILTTKITSPSSPGLVNTPGMMFTYGADKTIQYPPGMRIESM